MKFFRSLLLTVLTFLKSAAFITAALWLIGHIFHEEEFGSFEYSIMVKIFIASLAFIFTMSGLWKDKVAEEYAESRKFYKINSKIYYGLVLAGTLTILISELIGGWDGFVLFYLGCLIYVLAVIELVLSFFIHSIFYADDSSSDSCNT